MPITWSKLSTEYIVNTKWLKIRKDVVSLSNGVVVDDYYVIEKNDVALIIAIDNQERILLKKEYRYPIDKITLELPGGTFDKAKENPLNTAQRELLEETGYSALQWTELGHLYDYPTKDTNRVFIFIADQITLTAEQNLELTEDIEYGFYSIHEIKALIIAGQINVSGSVAALLKYLVLHRPST